MSDNSSFLDINDLSGKSKDQLLIMRRVLFNSVARNAQKEETKGMYLISLAIFTEFERLTKHITDPDITKS